MIFRRITVLTQSSPTNGLVTSGERGTSVGKRILNTHLCCSTCKTNWFPVSECGAVLASPLEVGGTFSW